MRQLEHEGCESALGFGNRDNTRAYGEPFLRNQAELIEQEEADWAYRNLLSGNLSLRLIPERKREGNDKPVSERTKLQDAAALLALHTDAELDAMREAYHSRTCAVRPSDASTGGTTHEGSVRWKQTYSNWLKKSARYYAYGTPKQDTEGHDPIEEFRELERELDSGRARRAGVSSV